MLEKVVFNAFSTKGESNWLINTNKCYGGVKWTFIDLFDDLWGVKVGQLDPNSIGL